MGPEGLPQAPFLGGHFLLEGDKRDVGTPGIEPLHEGPGSPLLSSCGPALGWNQECSKE